MASSQVFLHTVYNYCLSRHTLVEDNTIHPRNDSVPAQVAKLKATFGPPEFVFLILSCEMFSGRKCLFKKQALNKNLFFIQRTSRERLST